MCNSWSRCCPFLCINWGSPTSSRMLLKNYCALSGLSWHKFSLYAVRARIPSPSFELPAALAGIHNARLSCHILAGLATIAVTKWMRSVAQTSNPLSFFSSCDILPLYGFLFSYTEIFPLQSRRSHCKWYLYTLELALTLSKKWMRHYPALKSCGVTIYPSRGTMRLLIHYCLLLCSNQVFKLLEQS